MILYGIRYVFKRLFNRFKAIGWPVGFEYGVTITNAQYISIGNSVFIGKNAIIQIPEEAFEITKKPQLIIKEKVTIGMNSWINAAKSIIIHKNVLIGPNCFIADHSHKYTDPKKPIRFQGIDNVKAVVIKENAWICANVVINPGVTIGTNSVIGANSVVTKDVPDYSVAGGIPAKIIKKYNFKSRTWEKI